VPAGTRSARHAWRISVACRIRRSPAEPRSVLPSWLRTRSSTAWCRRRSPAPRSRSTRRSS